MHVVNNVKKSPCNLAPYFFVVSCWQKLGRSRGLMPLLSPRHRWPMRWREAQTVQNVPCFGHKLTWANFLPFMHDFNTMHALIRMRALVNMRALHACRDMPCMHKFMRASLHVWHVKPNMTTSPDSARQREHSKEIVTWSRFTYNNSGLLMEDWRHHPTLWKKIWQKPMRWVSGVITPHFTPELHGKQLQHEMKTVHETATSCPSPAIKFSKGLANKGQPRPNTARARARWII